MPTLDWPLNPIVFTPQGLLNPAVVALIAMLCAQLVKASVPERPLKPLLVNGIVALVVGALEFAAAFLVADTPEAYASAALLTLWGTAAATLGYESLKNLCKALGLWKAE